MRVKVEQLRPALQKSLAAVYFITGEEPLQLGEAADDVRAAAKKTGYTTREVIDIDNGNEWYKLTSEADSLSIFSEKKLIDLRFPSGKPGIEGSKVLLAYCRDLPVDTVLLLTAGKLETSSLKSQWFQALDREGVIVQVWPLQGSELLSWLQRRAERKGMQLEQDALKSLATRIEGNLLAAAQEIEKLYILHGQNRISKAMVEDEVADSSRFDVFNFSDSLLQGNLNRSIKILHGLQAEGVAAQIVVWAISREARVLINIITALKQGRPRDQVFKDNQIWDKRKPVVQHALTRLKIDGLQKILQMSAVADQQSKGQLAGDCWDSLFNICLEFAETVPKI